MVAGGVPCSAVHTVWVRSLRSSPSLVLVLAIVMHCRLLRRASCSEWGDGLRAYGSCVWRACGVARMGEAGSFGGSLTGHREPSAGRCVWLHVLCMCCGGCHGAGVTT